MESHLSVQLNWWTSQCWWGNELDKRSCFRIWTVAMMFIASGRKDWNETNNQANEGIYIYATCTLETLWIFHESTKHELPASTIWPLVIFQHPHVNELCEPSNLANPELCVLPISLGNFFKALGPLGMWKISMIPFHTQLDLGKFELNVSQWNAATMLQVIQIQSKTNPLPIVSLSL